MSCLTFCSVFQNKCVSFDAQHADNILHSILIFVYVYNSNNNNSEKHSIKVKYAAHYKKEFFSWSTIVRRQNGQNYNEQKKVLKSNSNNKRKQLYDG